MVLLKKLQQEINYMKNDILRGKKNVEKKETILNVKKDEQNNWEGFSDWMVDGSAAKTADGSVFKIGDSIACVLNQMVGKEKNISLNVPKCEKDKKKKDDEIEQNILVNIKEKMENKFNLKKKRHKKYVKRISKSMKIILKEYNDIKREKEEVDKKNDYLKFMLENTVIKTNEMLRINKQSFQNYIDKMQKENVFLKKELDEESHQHHYDLQQLVNKITDMEKIKDYIVNKNEECNKKIMFLTVQCDKLKEKEEELHKIANNYKLNLEKEKKKKKYILKKIENSIKGREIDYNELKQKHHALQCTNDELSKNNTDLKEEIAKLKGQLCAKDNIINKSIEKINDLHSKHELLKSECSSNKTIAHDAVTRSDNKLYGTEAHDNHEYDGHAYGSPVYICEALEESSYLEKMKVERNKILDKEKEVFYVEAKEEVVLDADVKKGGRKKKGPTDDQLTSENGKNSSICEDISTNFLILLKNELRKNWEIYRDSDSSLELFLEDSIKATFENLENGNESKENGKLWGKLIGVLENFMNSHTKNYTQKKTQNNVFHNNIMNNILTNESRETDDSTNDRTNDNTVNYTNNEDEVDVHKQTKDVLTEGNLNSSNSNNSNNYKNNINKGNNKNCNNNKGNNINGNNINGNNINGNNINGNNKNCNIDYLKNEKLKKTVMEQMEEILSSLQKIKGNNTYEEKMNKKNCEEKNHIINYEQVSTKKSLNEMSSRASEDSSLRNFLHKKNVIVNVNRNVNKNVNKGANENINKNVNENVNKSANENVNNYVQKSMNSACKNDQFQNEGKIFLKKKTDNNSQKKLKEMSILVDNTQVITYPERRKIIETKELNKNNKMKNKGEDNAEMCVDEDVKKEGQYENSVKAIEKCVRKKNKKNKCADNSDTNDSSKSENNNANNYDDNNYDDDNYDDNNYDDNNYDDNNYDDNNYDDNNYDDDNYDDDNNKAENYDSDNKKDNLDYSDKPYLKTEITDLKMNGVTGKNLKGHSKYYANVRSTTGFNSSSVCNNGMQQMNTCDPLKDESKSNKSTLEKKTYLKEIDNDNFLSLHQYKDITKNKNEKFQQVAMLKDAIIKEKKNTSNDIKNTKEINSNGLKNQEGMNSISKKKKKSFNEMIDNIFDTSIDHSCSVNENMINIQNLIENNIKNIFSAQDT
ncbi:regulator of chromosome condensation, putative [Plasmodium malariae]|uniref:Regulator of chromosome condensation, putative n=1 Tax=Plasmodium malariae TaxID=5858 RepID=A0A1A8VYE0_PLAMA|nr:regulator of chromosome condensation, putative [Plasmodium malariae]